MSPRSPLQGLRRGLVVDTHRGKHFGRKRLSVDSLHPLLSALEEKQHGHWRPKPQALAQNSSQGHVHLRACCRLGWKLCCYCNTGSSLCLVLPPSHSHRCWSWELVPRNVSNQQGLPWPPRLGQVPEHYSPFWVLHPFVLSGWCL